MLLGLLFSFLASVCFNLNNLMEKRAVDGMTAISARRTGHMLRQLLTSRLWISGFFAGMVAVGFTVLAYSLAPIAVVQSVLGAGLVFLVLASRLYLHESMGRRGWLGVAIILVAVILVSVSLGSSSHPGAGGSTTYVLTASFATMALAVLVFAILARFSADAAIPFGVTSGLLYGVSGLQIKEASALLEHRGALKAVQHLVISPYPYMFLVTSVLGLLIFQSGLQKCRVAVVGPITNVVGSIYVVAVGMVVFDESLPRDTLLTLLRLCGFALVLVGGWVFATGPATVAQLTHGLAEELDVRLEHPEAAAEPG